MKPILRTLPALIALSGLLACSPARHQAFEIGQGQRRVNIEIPDYEAAELKPGTLVDIFTTYPKKNPSSGELEPITQTILQDVVVRQIVAHPSSTADAETHPIEPASFSRLFK